MATAVITRNGEWKPSVKILWRCIMTVLFIRKKSADSTVPVECLDRRSEI